MLILTFGTQNKKEIRKKKSNVKLPVIIINLSELHPWEKIIKLFAMVIRAGKEIHIKRDLLRNSISCKKNPLGFANSKFS